MYRIALSKHTKPDTPVCNTTVEFHYWGKKGQGLRFLKKIFRSLSVYYTHRTERPVLLRNARAEHAAFSEQSMRRALYCETHVRSAQHYYWLRNTRARLVLVFFFCSLKEWICSQKTNVDHRIKSLIWRNIFKAHLNTHLQSWVTNIEYNLFTLGPFLIGRIPDFISKVTFSSVSHCSNKSRISSSCEKLKINNSNSQQGERLMKEWEEKN